MKKILLIAFIISSAVVILFSGCATKQAPEEETVETVEPIVVPEEITEPEPVEIPSKYDDWKYKGFGTELPDWFEPALEYEDSIVRELLELPSDTLLRIIFTDGMDVDQCEQKLNEMSVELENDFEVLQAFWVRLNPEFDPELQDQENLYVSLRIYVSKDEVMEL